MPVFRVNKTSDYTVLSNYHFKDKSISLKAKGLLSQMLSLPNDWDYSIAGLSAINKESEGAINTALTELKEAGYLTITKVLPSKENGGRIEYIYNIFENPTKIQDPDFQGLEIQGTENPGQLNTNKLNTNKQKTKNENLIKNFGKPKPKKSNLYNDCFKEISLFTKDPDIQKLLEEYLDIRIKIKDKPLSLNGWKAILRKLNKSFRQQEWKFVIQQSIDNNWASFFAIPVPTKTGTGKKFTEYITHEKDTEDHTLTGQIF